MSKSVTKLPWNDYFRLRKGRNRIRPFFGIPAFFGGTGAVVRFYQFNPLEPILGIDASMVVGLGSVCAGVAAYQLGGSLGTAAWRLWNHDKLAVIDDMDTTFYHKIKTYRAERGQSPYINTMEGTTKMLKAKLQRKGKTEGTVQDAAGRGDFYGEKINSVQDYMHWLRRQRKWNKEHLGEEAAKIRGAH